MDVNTLKIGGGTIPSEKWNALVDQVIGEGDSTYWFKVGSGTVDHETFNRLAAQAGAEPHSGSGSIPPEVYNALVDTVIGEVTPH